MIDELEIGMVLNGEHIIKGACVIVIHADHPVPFMNQPNTQIGTQKTSSASYNYRFHMNTFHIN